MKIQEEKGKSHCFARTSRALNDFPKGHTAVIEL